MTRLIFFTIKPKLREGRGGGGDIHDIIACIKTAHQISNGLCKLRFCNINKVDTDEKTGVKNSMPTTLYL